MNKLKSLLIILCLFLFCGTGWGATWYTKVDPTNGATKICYSTTSFDNACTANSNKTFTDLFTALTAGDTIELSGGASGATYQQAVTVTKGVTINTSRVAGHNGKVTIDTSDSTNGIHLYPSSGTAVTVNGPIYHRCTSGTSYGLKFQAAAIPVVINDYHMETFRGTAALKFVSGLDVRINRSSFDDVGEEQQIYVNASAAVWTISYCRLSNVYLQFTGTLNLYNNVIINHSKIRSESLNAQATGVINSKNNVYLGCEYNVVAASTGATITSENDFYPPHVITFDSKSICTPTNPKRSYPGTFKDKRYGPGELVIAVDDMIADAYTFASDPAVIAAGLKMSFAYPINANTVTSTIVDQLRYLVNNGHEVASHGKTHSSFGTLNCGYSLSATGTSPTITISGTRSGDSTTWTGTISITINGTTVEHDLANASFDTIGELFTHLNGHAVGDGTITTVNRLSTDTKTAILGSLCLADVSGQSIATSYIPLLDEAAFIRYEATEGILNLQSYINSGTDRNGNDVIAGITQPAPNPAYVCHIYRASNGQGRAALETALTSQATTQIYGGTMIGEGTKVSDVWTNGVSHATYPVDPYMFYYENATDARYLHYANLALVGFRVFHPLYHTYPTYGGTIQGFVDFMNSYGLKGARLEDIITTITTSGDWTQSGANWYFSGDYSKYFNRGNLRLLGGSALKNAGSDACSTLTTATDLDGHPVCSGGAFVGVGSAPDIGAYEYHGKFLQ